MPIKHCLKFQIHQAISRRAHCAAVNGEWSGHITCIACDVIGTSTEHAYCTFQFVLEMATKAPFQVGAGYKSFGWALLANVREHRERHRGIFVESKILRSGKKNILTTFCHCHTHTYARATHTRGEDDKKWHRHHTAFICIAYIFGIT